MMTVSRLLKSWAMPPVSWPIASIFWIGAGRVPLAARSAVCSVQLGASARPPASPAGARFPGGPHRPGAVRAPSEWRVKLALGKRLESDNRKDA